MVAFYQRSISAWMDGTEGLDDGEYRAYDVICNLIYLNDGPIVMHESGIAGRCNQHPLRFRHNFAKLIEKKKIVVTEGGKITNVRVESELKKIKARRREKPADPATTPALPGGGRQGVSRGSAGGKAANPLKNKDPTLFGDRVENSREGTLANARGLSPIEAMRKELFDRGKEVLGAGAGGMIQKLLAAKHGNIALARAAIEQASTMDQPLEYVGGILKGGPNGKNGFGSLSTRLAAGNGTGAAERRPAADLQTINRR